MALDAISNSSYQEPNVYTSRLNKEVKEEIVNLSLTDKKADGSRQEVDTGLEKDIQTNEKKIRDAVTRVNNNLGNVRTRCEFTYHEKVKRVSIKILNSDTGEVIREIPPEDTIKMIEKMWELVGILFDEKG